MGPTTKQKDRRKQSSMPLGQRAPGEKAAAQQRSETVAPSLPIELQQKILDVFRRAFPFDHDELDLKVTVQEVKGHLFQRDFSRAFAKPEYLDAYALRWSAGRALGYTSILCHSDLQPAWSNFDEDAAAAQVRMSNSSPSWPSVEPHSQPGACSVLCIGGGGGAEVAACAVAARTLLSPLPHTCIHVVDVADWSTCLQKLETALCTPPELSVYASQSAKAANEPMISRDDLEVRFSRQDILSVNEVDLRAMVQGVHLCTLMFTLNELFSTSIAKTTAFLLALTASMSLGSYLLVVDSPGSYSKVKLGKGADAKGKQYPMKFLLGHVLLEVAGDGGKNSKWKQIISDDSRWFRLDQQALKYSIDLENMRYQIHLYQRVGPASNQTPRKG